MDFLQTGEHISRYKINDVFLYPEFIQQCNIIEFSKLNWKEVKFLDSDGNKHPDMAKITNKKGGIYIFCAKHNLLPTFSGPIMYIGRAHLSKSQNLRKRCSDYLSEAKRPKIIKMREYWGTSLFIFYAELDDNDLIDEVENRLIEAINPPFCSEIKNVTLRKATIAFS